MTSQTMLLTLQGTCLVGWLRVVLLYLFNIMPCFPDQSMPDHLPTITTLRSLFTRILDFNAIPRRSFFEYLRCFTSDTLEREKLDDFLSSEGAVGNSSLSFLRATFLLVHSPKDELYEYCYQVKRTILEVLADFRHVKIPRDYIFDVFPPLRPREFSIASSIKVSS